MAAALPPTMRVLLSDVRPDRSFVDFSLATRPTPTLTKDTEVIIRMEACPINPSDIGVIFGASRRLEAAQTGHQKVSAPIPERFRGTFETDQYGNKRAEGGIVCGNEGAGVVVAAGSAAKGLLGKVVAVFGSGGCYAEFRKASARGNSINVMPDGVTPTQAASSYVNPLTALGMLSTAKEAGHKALVHTAAASQLGRMMLKICAADNFPLVNVVRRERQAEELRAIDPGAIVVNQSLPTFEDDLAAAVKLTGATVAFDATGGGALSAKLLEAIDRAADDAKAGRSSASSPSSPHSPSFGKQLYNYGALDTSPSTMDAAQKARSEFWLLPVWAAQHRPLFAANMKRVQEEITTTFATTYEAEVAMGDAATVDAVRVWARQETGRKYLLKGC